MLLRKSSIASAQHTLHKVAFTDSKWFCSVFGDLNKENVFLSLKVEKYKYSYTVREREKETNTAAQV